jgi:starch-binding outer membrane protein, SusD/RagB family
MWKADGEYLLNDAISVRDPNDEFTDKVYKSLAGTKDAPNKGNNPLTSPAKWSLVWEEDNSKAVDPRLDWTVGRRGIPYLDWGVHTGSDWIRDQSYGGPYSPKKQVFKKSQEGQLTEVGNWTSGWTANGYRFIRYADVLLLLAETQIQTGDLDGALTNINLVRARAANADSWVKDIDAQNTAFDAATYDIEPYPAFADAAAAMKALRMERKLELGMEGHRFFDLQRWDDKEPGFLVAELQRILSYEKTLRPTEYSGAAVGAEDKYYPIPQAQIDVARGSLEQNR